MGGMESTLFLRMLIAGILGGAVGLERENHGRPAGLRTHVLVSLGSCLVMLVGEYALPTLGRDPFRLAAQVISGIGFLGAGTILREGLSVKGLTTAASLWVVAAVGISVGSGFYFAATACTILVVSSLILLSAVEARLPSHDHIYITLKEGSGTVDGVVGLLLDVGIACRPISITRGSGTFIIQIRTEAISARQRVAAMDALMSSGVFRAEFSGLSGFADRSDIPHPNEPMRR